MLSSFQVLKQTLLLCHVPFEQVVSGIFAYHGTACTSTQYIPERQKCIQDHRAPAENPTER